MPQPVARAAASAATAVARIDFTPPSSSSTKQQGPPLRELGWADQPQSQR